MTQEQENNQAYFEHRFVAGEDDLVDILLALLHREGWENLQMHYEAGNLSAEKTVLRVRSKSDSKEEFPVTFAFWAQWTDGDEEVDLLVEITESEYEWTYDECLSICDSILTALKNSFGMVEKSEFKESDNGHTRKEK